MTWADKEAFCGKRLLILDDKPEDLRRFKKDYEEVGFEVVTLLAVEEETINASEFYNEESLRQRVSTMNFDAVLTDGQMLGMTDLCNDGLFGEDAARIILEVKPNMPVAMHTAQYIEERSFGLGGIEQAIQEHSTKLQEIGGLGVFEKSDEEKNFPGDKDKILGAFNTAFEQGVKRA